MMEHKLYYLHTLTGLHIGCGNDGAIIDMPIARERASNLPHVPGSALKGVWRYELEASMKEAEKLEEFLALFGPRGENAHEHAGALAMGDARLLCLPVRSYRGTFAWATCPMVLHRYQRDMNNTINIPKVGAYEALVCVGSALEHNEKLYLEEFDLTASCSSDATDWAELIAKNLFDIDNPWQSLFKERFVILPDSLFSFLAETATEVRARIKIKEDTRTVQKGGLWYEEYLPAESILWGSVAVDRPRRPDLPKNITAQYLLNELPTKQRIQIGGNATIGAGQVQWMLSGVGG